jgi:tetratricopeptide (TPR) repeat protein
MNTREELLDPEQISARLEFHRRLVAEEAAAAAILDRVLTGPSRWWRNAVVQAEGSFTAGMVTVLVQRAADAMRQAPPDALILSEIAIGIANTIDVLAYPYDHVNALRGQALREQAYVLSCIGRHTEAIRVADLAEMLLEQTPQPLRELGKLDLVRSNIARNTEKYDRAIAFARRAGERFVAAGARTSRLIALFYEACAQHFGGNVAAALEIWRSMENETSLLTPEQRAARVHNMALCATAVGNFEEAARLYGRAAAEFERLGSTTNRVKCGYSIGVLMNESGRYRDAIPVLLKAEVELEALGLECDAALAALMRVEALLALGRTHDVAETCRRLIARFTSAEVTNAAMTALGYLRETVEKGKATAVSVRHIHDFLRDTQFGRSGSFTPRAEPTFHA